MNTKHTFFALAFVAALSLGFAGPAFAQTTGANDQSGHRGGPRSGVFGTVTAISGSKLTVMGMSRPGSPDAAPTYTVDASGAKIEKNDSASSVSVIVVGDKVMVRGTVNGTNVTATDVRDGEMQGGFGRRASSTAPVGGKMIGRAGAPDASHRASSTPRQNVSAPQQGQDGQHAAPVTQGTLDVSAAPASSTDNSVAQPAPHGFWGRIVNFFKSIF